VVINLLTNAVKFTDVGQVRLRVQLLERKAASARLRVTVSDTGIGMDEGQLARLFQPFEQVSEASRRVGGSGLGLSISQQLVRLMGSRIHVSSLPSEGSHFWFDLELPTQAPAHPLDAFS